MALFPTIYFFSELETAYSAIPIVLIRTGLRLFEPIAPNWYPSLRGPELE